MIDYSDIVTALSTDDDLVEPPFSEGSVIVAASRRGGSPLRSVLEIKTLLLAPAQVARFLSRASSPHQQLAGLGQPRVAFDPESMQRTRRYSSAYHFEPESLPAAEPFGFLIEDQAESRRPEITQDFLLYYASARGARGRRFSTATSGGAGSARDVRTESYRYEDQTVHVRRAYLLEYRGASKGLDNPGSSAALARWARRGRPRACAATARARLGGRRRGRKNGAAAPIVDDGEGIPPLHRLRSTVQLPPPTLHHRPRHARLPISWPTWLSDRAGPPVGATGPAG